MCELWGLCIWNDDLAKERLFRTVTRESGEDWDQDGTSNTKVVSQCLYSLALTFQIIEWKILSYSQVHSYLKFFHTIMEIAIQCRYRENNCLSTCVYCSWIFQSCNETYITLIWNLSKLFTKWKGLIEQLNERISAQGLQYHLGKTLNEWHLLFVFDGLFDK